MIIGDVCSLRVLIADERVAFRQCVRAILEPEAGLTIVGEASCATVLPRLLRRLKPDVLIIDVRQFLYLSSQIGVEPAFKAVVTIPTVERASVIEAFLKGARAVLPKLSPAHFWHESIRAVGSAQYWVAGDTVAVLVQALKDNLPHGATTRATNKYKLTPREVEIVDKIAQGHSNKEVGLAFSICERTVKHHLTSIFTKVGVSSRLELALFALNNRLPETPVDWKTASAAGVGGDSSGKNGARVKYR